MLKTEHGEGKIILEENRIGQTTCLNLGKI